MTAGRELDVLVATHVFHWGKAEFTRRAVPQWSTNRELSWQVLDRMLQLNWYWAMTPNFITAENSKTGQRIEYLQGETQAERICAIALMATGGEPVPNRAPPTLKIIRTAVLRG